MKNDSGEIKVKVNCRRAPLGLMWHLRRSLSWIPQDDLENLDYIWLMDDIPDGTEDEDARHAREGECILYGAYKARQGDRPSYVLLFVRYVYEGIPALYWLTPVITWRMTRTLAHEVAHHALAQRGYIFHPGEDEKDEEALAERYAAEVLDRMAKRWHYRLARWVIRDLAETHYILGIVAWKSQRYCKAADKWFKAWNLNPNLDEVANWYYHARKLCEERREQKVEK